MNRSGFTYTWHQDHTEPFDEAEFYENGPIVTVRRGSLAISVDRDGEADYELTGNEDVFERVRSPEQFREWFPSGEVPVTGSLTLWTPDGDDSEPLEGEWSIRYNAWFDLYDATEGRSDDPNEWPIPSDDGHIDNVTYSLTEAIADAERILEEAPSVDPE